MCGWNPPSDRENVAGCLYRARLPSLGDSASASRTGGRTSDVGPDSKEFAPHFIGINESATPAPALHVALDLVHLVRGCSACPEEVQERRLSTHHNPLADQGPSIFRQAVDPPDFTLLEVHQDAHPLSLPCPYVEKVAGRGTNSDCTIVPPKGYECLRLSSAGVHCVLSC
jgi:hypothetical protein